MEYTYRDRDCTECDGRMILRTKVHKTKTGITTRGLTRYRNTYKDRWLENYWMCENLFSHTATYIPEGEIGLCSAHGGTDIDIAFDCEGCAVTQLEIQAEKRLGL